MSAHARIAKSGDLVVELKNCSLEIEARWGRLEIDWKAWNFTSRDTRSLAALSNIYSSRVD